MSWELEKKEFYKFIIQNNVIGFFDEPITLKSGRQSYWYVNWRNIAEDVFLFDILTDYLISYVKHLNLKPDCFYGVPEGATKLGVITQYKWAISDKNLTPGKFILSMGRAKPKEHGALKDKFFLGIPKGRVIIVEDTTTTGGSLLKTELRDDGRTVEEAIKLKNIQYFAMSDAFDLLPNLNPNETIKSHIKNYFKKYGSKEIEF
jgi:orotate phosphoribosyltransferase